jgi:hypothetical protein
LMRRKDILLTTRPTTFQITIWTLNFFVIYLVEFLTADITYIH